MCSAKDLGSQVWKKVGWSGSPGSGLHLRGKRQAPLAPILLPRHNIINAISDGYKSYRELKGEILKGKRMFGAKIAYNVEAWSLIDQDMQVHNPCISRTSHWLET